MQYNMYHTNYHHLSMSGVIILGHLQRCWRPIQERFDSDWLFLLILGIIVALISFSLDFCIDKCQQGKWKYNNAIWKKKMICPIWHFNSLVYFLIIKLAIKFDWHGGFNSIKLDMHLREHSITSRNSDAFSVLSQLPKCINNSKEHAKPWTIS